MPISLEDFRQKIAKNTSVAPVNRFSVTFIPINSAKNETAQDLKFFCEIAELPGRNLMTTEEKTYGPIRKIPYASSYIETNMTFLCTSNGLPEKRYFDDWMDLINNPITHDIQYYDNYTNRDIKIEMYDDANKTVYICTLKEGYPILVSSITLNMANKDDYARINVTFAYRYWIRNNDLNPEIDSNINYTNQINVNEFLP